MLETTIDLAAALARRRNNALIIDVRTPAEFTETTIPGAVNVPLFSNDERAEVGTLYKHQGKMIARRHAIELVSPRIPDFIRQIEHLQRQHHPPAIVFCWRGGLRSHAMTTFLNLAGLPARQLIGGHKSFRTTVCNHFDNNNWAPIFVLRGLTGVGKTWILEQLQQQNYPVVNLEKLANHRGSAFGALGLPPQPSQKMFEALLWERLDQLKDSPFLVTEGESRHIGRVTIPLRFHQAMQLQPSFWLSTSLEQRVRIIRADYPELNRFQSAFRPPIDALKERLGGTVVARFQQLLTDGHWELLIEELMKNYYDPLYQHTLPQQRIDISYETPEQGVQRVATAIDEMSAAMDGPTASSRVPQIGSYKTLLNSY